MHTKWLCTFVMTQEALTKWQTMLFKSTMLAQLFHFYPALTKCSQVSHLKSHKAKRLQANAVAVRQTCRSVTINSNLKKLLVGIFSNICKVDSREAERSSKLRLNVKTAEQKFQLRQKNKYKKHEKEKKCLPLCQQIYHGHRCEDKHTKLGSNVRLRHTISFNNSFSRTLCTSQRLLD